MTVIVNVEWSSPALRPAARYPVPNGYVISMRSTGLGDRLICLGAAWVFARNTGRTLVADWRFSQYSPDVKTNLFRLCFHPDRELAGVRFIGDDSVGNLNLPSPRYPPLWNADSLLHAPFLRPTKSLLADRDAAVALIRSGNDVDAPTVVFDACVNDGLVRTADSRTFLSALRPIEGLADKAARFRRKHLCGGPLIGLHIRHGNGGITGHDGYWRSFHDAIDRCVLAVRRARDQLGETALVFLCTDNVEVERTAWQRISRVISRNKNYRRSGEGELHLWSGAHQGRDDAMVEMLLLAECDALIRYPPGSFFSFYGAVMKRWRTSIPETVYDLLRPYDPEDPLSPALLI